MGTIERLIREDPRRLLAEVRLERARRGAPMLEELHIIIDGPADARDELTPGVLPIRIIQRPIITR